MALFEYKITSHSAEDFREMAWFCSAEGVCNLEKVPVDQIQKVEGMLNERGRMGWELLQISFGKDGMLIFWKRTIGGV